MKIVVDGNQKACESNCVMKKPTIEHQSFWNLPAVKAGQEMQKRNPYGSAQHRAGFDMIRKEAAKYNAEQFIGEYED